MTDKLKNLEHFTINSIKQSSNSNITKIGDDLILFSKLEDIPVFSRSCYMDGVLICLCLEGKAKVSLSTKEYTVSANDVLLVNHGQVVSDFMMSRDCRGVAFFGTRDFFQEMASGVSRLSSLFLYIRSNPVFPFNSTEVTIFRDYFNAIQERAQWTQHRFLKEVSCTLIRAMVLDLGNRVWDAHRNAAVNTKSRAEVIFSQFIHLVEEHFKEERKVSWYALKLDITPKYLSETVKLVSRQTPNEWIDKYVVMQLRVYLRNSTMSIKEITDAMHFPNQSFLGKYFKEHVGLSPTEYRRKM